MKVKVLMLILSKCYIMTCIVIILVLYFFYAIVHDVSKKWHIAWFLTKMSLINHIFA